MLRVEVRSGGDAVAGAAILVNGTTTIADRTGAAELTIAAGRLDLTVTRDGYLPATIVLTIAAGERRTVPVELQKLQEEVFVTAARSTTRLQDQPLRVEVVDQEEIDEKAMMTPGSVAMLVNETTGLRVQTTAPTLGAANVRIQGLRGRYSQLLADGLPLYGAQGDSLGLLQVPPLDLGQVEIIKGVASALYGASALGGVINLVSRRPRETESRLLVNTTSQSGRDVAGFHAEAPAGAWSWTLLGSYNGQTRRDLDGDGWSDLPTFNRGVLRPRVFFDNRQGSTAFATLGVIVENRDGGTLPTRTAPDGRPFREAIDTRHVDGGFAGRWLTAGSRVWSVRGSVLRQQQQRQWGEVSEHGTRAVWFGESVAARHQRPSYLGHRQRIPAGSLHAGSVAAVRFPLFGAVGVCAGRSVLRPGMDDRPERPGRRALGVRNAVHAHGCPLLARPWCRLDGSGRRRHRRFRTDAVHRRD